MVLLHFSLDGSPTLVNYSITPHHYMKQGCTLHQRQYVVLLSNYCCSCFDVLCHYFLCSHFYIWFQCAISLLRFFNEKKTLKVDEVTFQSRLTSHYSVYALLSCHHIQFLHIFHSLIPCKCCSCSHINNASLFFQPL